MDTHGWNQIEALFTALLDQKPEERAAYLNEVCGEANALREELEAMLSAHEQERGLAIEGRLLADSEQPYPQQDPLIGSHIGPYQLMYCIGRGGMGDVYLAQRNDEQYKQKVALKLIRSGLQNSQIMDRFKVERQVLARLTHPNITQLLNGGIDASGRPYLVMQYVKGLPITSYCDQNALSINERLSLFLTVCNAVQHAHRNLVVHRDLKPSNILVTEDRQVKLLDFGIAKILDPDWGQTVAVTQTNMLLLTPEYAAPEQIKGENISTATDVYALGILLYELLSGRRPYQIGNKMQSEVERIICEVDPARPSTAVTELISEQKKKTTPEEIGKARRMGVSRLKKILQGDLDNIVLKALRKEPTRRYSSASELSADIDRYRSGLPVIAQKDSMTYRMRKFVRRHRAGVAFSALFIVALIGFSIFAVYQSGLVRAERDAARLEKKRAEQVIGLLVSLFETANPAIVPGGDTLRVGEFIERGVQKTLEEVETDSALAIPVKHTLGQMYSAQGQYREGHSLLKDAYEMQEALYGEYDTTTTAYLNELSTLTWRMGDKETAHTMFVELLERNKVLFGDEHPRIAQSLKNLSLTATGKEEKQALMEASLDMQRRLMPPAHVNIADALNQLAVHHHGYGECDLALPLFEESLSILEASFESTHPYVLSVMGNITNCMNYQGNALEAIRMQRDVISRLQTITRDSSVQMANAWNNLAVFLTLSGSFQESEIVFRRVYRLQSGLLGATHHRTVSTMRNLAISIAAQQNYDTALSLLHEAVTIKKGAFLNNQDPAQYINMLAQYAQMLVDAGRKKEALNEIQHVLKLAEQTDDIPESYRGNIWTIAALIFLENDQPVLGVQLAEQALQIRSDALKPDHPRIAQAEIFLGLNLAASNRPEEALQRLEAGYPGFASWPLAHPKRVETAGQVIEKLSRL